MDSQPYLQKGYSIKDMSQKLNLSVHHISYYLNYHLKINFNDYINKQRIKYSVEKINNGELNKMTIEALAIESGFSNRNSFITAFKKFNGKTPSQFIKSASAN